MADRVGALLAEAPGLQVASRLTPRTIPVLPAFEGVLPYGGLQPGTTVRVGGLGATSLALALVARASTESWTAMVGGCVLGLGAAAELGVDLDRFVVVPDPGRQWDPVLSCLVDAFDVVLAHSPPTHQVGRGTPPNPRARLARRLGARVREQDAVLVVVGRWAECDLAVEGVASTWHGLSDGHGHLRARALAVDVTGRGIASRRRRSTLWLPDPDGEVSLAASVTPLRAVR